MALIMMVYASSSCKFYLMSSLMPDRKSYLVVSCYILSWVFLDVLSYTMYLMLSCLVISYANKHHPMRVASATCL